MDVLLSQTPDGGEIQYVNGAATLSPGLETAVYLSLFGGNEDDDGSQGAERKQWWGNLATDDPATTYRSETQFLLRSIPSVPANLRRIEDAVNRDLQWLLDSKVATQLGARCTIPALNAINIAIGVLIDGKQSQFSFTKPTVGAS